MYKSTVIFFFLFGEGYNREEENSLIYTQNSVVVAEWS